MSHPDEAARASRCSPAADDLARVCLPETQAEPSLQATQMALKRARLADDLNEKIAQRPGAMELVEKNILAVEQAAEEAHRGRSPGVSRRAVGKRKTLLSCSACA